MPVFNSDAFDGHESVHFFRDPDSGLKAIIAIHDTTLGPAGGGVRFWPYDSDAEALRDALRLSRAMSFKLALAGIAIGGGKSVVIGDPRRVKTPELLTAFGRAVDQLGGRYICAEDVGTTPDDMAVISQVTSHVVGLPGESGDTSPATGHGVFHGIRAAAARRLGSEDLSGLTVTIQGCGNVARHLARMLVAAGAELVVADIDRDAADRMVREFGARSVDPGEIYDQTADIFAPCALGGVLNDDTIPRLKAAIVCGGANNQLAEERHGRQLAEHGILYAPDYVVNAGGAMSASREALSGVYDDTALEVRVSGIHETCITVFDYAEAHGIDPGEAADRLAHAVIEAAR